MQYIHLNRNGVFPFTRKQVVLIMAGMMLALFLASLDQTVVGTATPRIVADLGGFAHYAWIATAYMITSTVVLPLAGKLTDMYGPKYSYLVGLVLFIAGSVLCGLSQSMLQIIIFRGLQGLGAGVLMANAFTVVADLFPPERRAKYMGMTAAVFGLSSVIGPTLGGYLTDSLSWHWVFFINIPLSAAVLALFVFFFPAFRHSDEKQKMDYPGLFTLVTCVVPFMLAISWGGSQFGWTSPIIISMLVVSALSLGLFLVVEKKAAQPIIPLAIFRDQSISLSFVITFLSGIGMFGAIIFIPLYYQGVLGLSASSSGAYLMPMMLSMIFAALIAGGIVSKLGHGIKVLGWVGLAVMAFGLFLMSRLTPHTGYVTSIAYIVVTGFGLGITMPIYMLLIQNSVTKEVMGSASSLVGFARSIGGSIGLTVFGTMMTTLFSHGFAAQIPASLKLSVPPEILSTVGQNPQSLVSPQMQQQLQHAFENMGLQGETIYGQLFDTIRGALTSALGEIFLVAMGVIIVALLLNFFLKERPRVAAQARVAIPVEGKLVPQEVRLEN